MVLTAETQRRGEKMNLQEYMKRQDAPETQAFLKQQWVDACDKSVITCLCGQRRALVVTYRCFYCGVFLCSNCAAEHFGKYSPTSEQHSEPLTITPEPQRGSPAVKQKDGGTEVG